MFRFFRRRPREPEPPWRKYRSDYVCLTLDDASSYTPWGTDPTSLRATIPQMALGLFNNARSAFSRNVLRRRSRAPELDEHGFPVDWRVHPEDPDQQWYLSRSAEHWPIFERWCQERSLRAFPASAKTVLSFILDPPVEGQELCDTWVAITFRHQAYYWVEDTDPCYLLTRKGVDVRQDGTVIVPDEARQAFGL